MLWERGWRLSVKECRKKVHFAKYKTVIALTHAGTGKTVIAAFDYRNFRKKHPGEACRLLFVAHWEEIITQSRDTFQSVLRDLNFDELFVGNHVPENFDYLFISIQAMNSQKLYDKLAPDYYEKIDERGMEYAGCYKFDVDTVH